MSADSATADGLEAGVRALTLAYSRLGLPLPDANRLVARAEVVGVFAELIALGAEAVELTRADSGSHAAAPER